MKLDPDIHITMHSVLSLKPGVTTRWKWNLSHSVRIGDLWHNPLYNGNGLELMPRFPIITQRKHVVYLSVINYDYNWESELMEPSELYVLGIHMKHRRVVSSFKAPSEEYGGIRIIPDLTMAYPSNITVMILDLQITITRILG